MTRDHDASLQLWPNVNDFDQCKNSIVCLENIYHFRKATLKCTPRFLVVTLVFFSLHCLPMVLLLLCQGGQILCGSGVLCLTIEDGFVPSSPLYGNRGWSIQAVRILEVKLLNKVQQWLSLFYSTWWYYQVKFSLRQHLETNVCFPQSTAIRNQRGPINSSSWNITDTRKLFSTIINS